MGGMLTVSFLAFFKHRGNVLIDLDYCPRSPSAEVFNLREGPRGTPENPGHP
jgi:hypothetical protein